MGDEGMGTVRVSRGGGGEGVGWAEASRDGGRRVMGIICATAGVEGVVSL